MLSNESRAPKAPGIGEVFRAGQLARIMASHSSHESHARGLLGYRRELEMWIEDCGPSKSCFWTCNWQAIVVHWLNQTQLLRCPAPSHWRTRRPPMQYRAYTVYFEGKREDHTTFN